MAYKYLNDNGLKAYTKKVKGALKDLHTPIAISTLNTTESNAQNVRNIADFVAKAKAAGITDVDGMAVTCLLSSGYSGVGYLHFVDGNYTLQGVEIQEELERSNCFLVWDDGSYKNTNLITGDVTSQDLAKGARRPIILTSDTTEVDEETYQKLLSDDVDVVFKLQQQESTTFIPLVLRVDKGRVLEMLFTLMYQRGYDISQNEIYIAIVDIKSVAPHTCDVMTVPLKLGTVLNDSGYLNKSTISPLLQEISLTGTNEERKAKLDKFEADWKALTGASDLKGARFVGNDGGEVLIMTYSFANGEYEGIDVGSTDQMVYRYTLELGGTLHITPLFSHLEPVEILMDNSVASKQKNIDNLNAYKTNLEELGVGISNGYSVPVRITGNAQEYHGMLNIGAGALLSGIVTDANETHHYPFKVSTADGAITFDVNNYFLEKTSNEVTEMLDAIKYSYTSVPLTATTSTNKTQLDLFLSKVPNAQVMHVTYKDVYAGTLHKIGTDWFGLLVKNTNNYEDALQAKLQADGTLIEGTTSLAQVNATLNNIIG